MSRCVFRCDSLKKKNSAENLRALRTLEFWDSQCAQWEETKFKNLFSDGQCIVDPPTPLLTTMPQWK